MVLFRPYPDEPLAELPSIVRGRRIIEPHGPVVDGLDADYGRRGKKLDVKVVDLIEVFQFGFFGHYRYVRGMEV